MNKPYKLKKQSIYIQIIKIKMKNKKTKVTIATLQ